MSRDDEGLRCYCGALVAAPHQECRTNARPENEVVDLMAALEESLRAARSAKREDR